MSEELEVIVPDGRLDVTSAASFRKEVNLIAAKRPKYLLIDLSKVNFMDSSGLGALVSALKTVRTVDGEMAICSLNEQVKMLFDLTSMSKIFSIYSDRQEFEQKISEG
ncbi:anti-sigma-factor antagonist [Thalassoporum mexicanum PCC 7367]|uniref:STAS domain-containing protein n=1 Tax=Thalassoporum mexicanum TaxID=3457544 RepID=UPI00029FA8D6|nr:STAS domain-containing protein [Pseudanabaena sp. PCC 7367]AFY68501.1 anti-sigma-factor antagonist [Pseudanabaena sp. PCC 7367]